MSEKVPALILNMTSGEKLKMTPENSSLYTFLGETAIGDLVIDNSSVNHAFITTGTNERGQPTGLFLFAEFDPTYKEVAAHMVEHHYPMVLNQRSVPLGDFTAWQNRVDLETAQFHASLEGVKPEDF